MNIYIAKGNQQTGPFTEQCVKRMVAAGDASPFDLAWHDALPDWIPLNQILTFEEANQKRSSLQTPQPPQIVNQEYQQARFPQSAALPPSMQIPNYLTQSILVTIFCCPPFGIPAIVFSNRVNEKIRIGDMQGAIAASRQAKLWMWLGVGVGIIFLLLVIILQVAAAATGVE